MAIDWSRYPNFGREEFVCRCGCGRADMDPLFLSKLQAIRSEMGIPMRVTSGYRCPDHNDRVSSSGRDGPHTTGKAADIGCDGRDAYRLLAAALKYRMQGIGINQKGDGRFLHFDTLAAPHRPRVWSY